ncbi:MAG: hypothetical protein ACHP8B_12235, partial [Terriglobales bacterium]
MKNFWTVTGLALLFCTSMLISSAAQKQEPTPNDGKSPTTKDQSSGKTGTIDHGKIDPGSGGGNKDGGNKGGGNKDGGNKGGGNKGGGNKGGG